jgi:hypothetical protein
MGWYENQKARNEAHKAQQRQAKVRRAQERQVEAEAAPVAAPARVEPVAEQPDPRPIDPAVMQQIVNNMRASTPEQSRMYGRAATLFGIEAWIAGIQLILLVVPVLLVLGFIAWLLIF